MGHADWFGIILIGFLLLVAIVRVERVARRAAAESATSEVSVCEPSSEPEEPGHEQWLLPLAAPTAPGEQQHLVGVAVRVLQAHEEDLRQGDYQTVAETVVEAFRIGPAAKARRQQFGDQAEEVRQAVRAGKLRGRPCDTCRSVETTPVKPRVGYDDRVVVCEKGHVTFLPRDPS